MALLIRNYELGNGLFSYEGYIVIDTISGNKDSMGIDVKVYVSEEAYDVGQSYIENKMHSFVPDSSDSAGNYHKQAYEYLKLLPEYERAIDT